MPELELIMMALLQFRDGREETIRVEQQHRHLHWRKPVDFAAVMRRHIELKADCDFLRTMHIAPPKDWYVNDAAREQEVTLALIHVTQDGLLIYRESEL